ncbi:hypothetical protein F511_11274 [Dorcoceras hygrometricum]|uniref:Uncharacterized protein n=1 Tax=Dorcoceras hygrometricum TaxID=472368 RepID=A0A2Z7AS86_9LAMI|nr:hypothetical protein F511_11274 [Dorcoceras hygrometricum]
MIKSGKSSVLTLAEKCKNILASNWQGSLNTIKADAKGSKEEICTSKVQYFVKKGKPFIWVPEKDLHNVPRANTNTSRSSVMSGDWGIGLRSPGRLQPQTTRQRASEVCPAKLLRCLSQATNERKREQVYAVCKSMQELVCKNERANLDSQARRVGVVGGSSRADVVLGPSPDRSLRSLLGETRSWNSPRAIPELFLRDPCVMSDLGKARRDFSDSIVSSTAASVDGVPPSSETNEPWLPELDELPVVPWYEEKSSTLKLSDISLIKERGGMMDKFEVALPHPDERAHRPPPGFHTFYVNQLDMGLRFPIPRFLTSLCKHIKISPIQLAPNSYSFLLAPAVLLSYHDLPLTPYVLMQLVQIKRLGPVKFYISHKGDHTFIKGNPSSHKGWMSRFFYIKRDGKRRSHWRCDMSWRDNGERMGKADMLAAWDEAVGASSEATAAPTMVTKKRKASVPAEKEARRHKKKKGASTSEVRGASATEERRAPTPPTTTTERREPTPVFDIPEASSPQKGSVKESGPERVLPLNYFEDSLVVSPTAAVATKYLCHMAPARDLDRLAGASDTEAVGLFTSQIASAIAWGGEVVKRLTRAQREASDNRHLFVEAMGNHAELMAQLEELRAIRAQEKKAAEAEALRAQLVTERTARAIEEEALRIELEVALEGKTAAEAELEEARARAEEIGRLRTEAANAWDVGKEDFLKSSEFDKLCAKKSVCFFRAGFESCVAQLRANGYSKEEHPVSFLSIRKGLKELPDDNAEAEEEGGGSLGR